MTPQAGISALSYWYPETQLTIEELHDRGLVESDPAVLRQLGFDRIHVADPEELPDLGVFAGRRLLETHDIDPASIDVLIFFSGLEAPAPPSAEHPQATPSLLDRFRFSASRLQHQLGLSGATAFKIYEQGCASLVMALRTATALVGSGDAEKVLCIGADFVPPGFSREVIFNVLSDGASAMLIEAGSPSLRPVAFRQITKGYYWDSPTRRNEIVAAYYPTARRVILDAVHMAGANTTDIALFIPDNIGLQSWKVLLGLLGIPMEVAFMENIAAHGHFVSADSVMNLKDALERNPVAGDALILLFTFGFGANWSAAALRA